MLKDLRLSQEAARLAEADSPIGRAACELYAKLVETEHAGKKDFSALLPYFTNRGRQD